MVSKKSRASVEIFGLTYQVRGEADQPYIEEIASFVDRRMRDLARQTPVASPLKIAVLAALNISDELFRERDEKHRLIEDVERRTGALADALQERLRPFLLAESMPQETTSPTTPNPGGD